MGFKITPHFKITVHRVSPHPIPPCSTSSRTSIITLFSLKRQDKALEEVGQGQLQVASDHGLELILFRPGRSGEDKLGFEVIRGLQH